MKLSDGDIDVNPVRVTRVNEHIVRLRISYTLGVIFLASVYAPTGMSEWFVKEASYAQLQTVVESCPKGDMFIVLCDFSATDGTESVGLDMCWSPWIWIKN